MNNPPPDIDDLDHHSDVNDDASGDAEKKRKIRPRTTELGVNFVDGNAEGWFFGVPDVFRSAMDIHFGRFVNKEATKKLRAEKGVRDDDGKLRNAYGHEWRRGIPPARSFSQGDVFYNPPTVRKMLWSEALPLLNAIVRVTDAQPDSLEEGNGGWIEFEVTEYDRGAPSGTKKFNSLQGEFETFLRTGKLAEITLRPN
jgi:hypothetical protein